MGDSRRIVNGPTLRVLLNAFSKNGERASVTFKTDDDVVGSSWVVIVGLGKDWWMAQGRFAPHPDLSSTEMEKLLGKSFDWKGALWFEGYLSMPSIPAWGIYNPKSKEGILLSQYIGDGIKFYKMNP